LSETERVARLLRERARLTPPPECACDPPGSGEEHCTGHCFLRAEIARLLRIETAARNLDAHSSEGWATLVSYLIRLHEALAS
jgi:hypothetical protein